MLDDFAGLIPDILMNKSGSVFYSGRTAFKGLRPLYILGLNPGGDPDKQSDETVGHHTMDVMTNKPNNWSEYRDERWANKPPGQHGMQPRVLHLLNRLNLDPGEIPASNIVFLRSRQEETFEGNMLDIAEQCWPVHQAIIQRLGVRVILCFGRTAGAWIRAKTNATEIIGEFIERNNRKWSNTLYENFDGLVVADFTHPSRVDWRSPETDPSELLSEVLVKKVAEQKIATYPIAEPDRKNNAVLRKGKCKLESIVAGKLAQPISGAARRLSGCEMLRH